MFFSSPLPLCSLWKCLMLESPSTDLCSYAYPHIHIQTLYGTTSKRQWLNLITNVYMNTLHPPATILTCIQNPNINKATYSVTLSFVSIYADAETASNRVFLLKVGRVFTVASSGRVSPSALVWLRPFCMCTCITTLSCRCWLTELFSKKKYSNSLFNCLLWWKARSRT